MWKWVIEVKYINRNKGKSGRVKWESVKHPWKSSLQDNWRRKVRNSCIRQKHFCHVWNHPARIYLGHSDTPIPPAGACWGRSGTQELSTWLRASNFCCGTWDKLWSSKYFPSKFKLGQTLNEKQKLFLYFTHLLSLLKIGSLANNRPVWPGTPM